MQLKTLNHILEKSLVKTALIAFAIFANSTQALAARECSSLFDEASTRYVARTQAEVASARKIGKITISALYEPDKGARLKHDAEIVAKVANDLGLETPPHFINLMPSDQLDALASRGGHPAPHWHDGMEVVKSAGQSRGVLEFVTDGCAACRAFYSAATRHEEQRSILMHVAGHNDMSATSLYQKIRPNDGPLASYQLAKAISDAYSTYNREEVVLFFQYLKSFQQLQDYVDGTFEDPKTFEPSRANKLNQKVETRSYWDGGVGQVVGGFLDNLVPEAGKKQAPAPMAGWKKTTSVLQAMTEMLPPEAPDWQRGIVKLFEQANRMWPGNFQTKIVNEGWASLQQYLIARHTPWTKSADLVKYAQLMSGVVWESFDNPYWLGSSLWWNLYHKFMQRPEIKSLPTEIEKDRKFIAWARKFYERKNDTAFVTEAIDEHWVQKHDFFLYRATQHQEMDPSVPPDKQGLIALSRDWKRVRNYILAKHVNKKLSMIPSISLLNPYHTQGIVTLVQNTALGLPLEITTATKTLFVMAQYFHRPVRIEALLERSIFEGEQHTVQRWGELPAAPKTIPAVITVTMNGKVSLVVEGREDLGGNAQLEKIIDSYKTDVLGSFGQAMTNEQLRKWTKVAAQVGDHQLNSNAHELIDYAPLTGPAVREYLTLVEKRLRKSLDDAINGAGKIDVGAKGVRLPVLPEIPTFNYSYRFVQQRNGAIPPAPVDARGMVSNLDFNADMNGTSIGRGKKLPGDKWSPKKDKGDGKGEGEGEEGEGEGEPADADGEGEAGPGKGSGSPSDVTIPLNLYGELLSEMLELPNVRRKSGETAEVVRARNGAITNPAGNNLWDETLMQTVNKVRALRKAKHLPELSTNQLISEAMKWMEPSDYRVSGKTDRPRPVFKAVVVMNVDLTGSMWPDRIKWAKNFAYNLRAILGAKYDEIRFEYVGFDSTAERMTEKQIFRQFKGGGTSYESAAEMDKEILEEYPEAQWNRYVVTAGDAETAKSDADAYVNTMASLKDTLQFAALLVTNERPGQWTDDLVNAHRQLESEWEWASTSFIRNEGEIFSALKNMFKAENKK